VLSCSYCDKEGKWVRTKENHLIGRKIMLFAKLYLDVACCFRFNDYKPMIMGNADDIDQINKIFNELECGSGADLLEKLQIMANRLLDYKFWFREIKKYRRFRARFVLPKAISFSGLLNMDDYLFESLDIVGYDLIQTDKFVMHNNPLEEWRSRNNGTDLYVKNAEWNIQKWYWFPIIIEETVDEPVLRDLMLHIPSFYDDIDIIRAFINDIDIEGTNPIKCRPEFRPREKKINSLNLRYLFYSKPKKHPILVVKAVYILGFLKNALINGFNEYGEYYSTCFVIGVNVMACFNRNYNYGYDSF
jgi:hypothetical protein